MTDPAPEPPSPPADRRAGQFAAASPTRFGRARLRVISRDILLSGAVGIAAGLGAIAFQILCRVVLGLGLEGVAGYVAGNPAGEGLLDGMFPAPSHGVNLLLLAVVLIAGGLISGALVYLLAPEAEGHGTDAAIRAFHRQQGRIPWRVPFVKLVASAVTLGTGGSGGREGPIAQIGAGFGSILATRLRLSHAERRTLMLAGIGAGIGAIFRAPLAGAIFAIEVLYIEPDFEAEALLPAFMATTVASSVFGMVFGFEPLFRMAPMSFTDPLLLLPLTALAGMMVLASWSYVRCLWGLHDFFHRLRVPKMLRPAIGAAATAAVAIGTWFALESAGFGQGAQRDGLSILSFGYGFLQKALLIDSSPASSHVLVLLIVVGIGKIVTTSLTIGLGGSAGVFGPSMVIGGALGGAVGIAFHAWMPGVAPRVEVFVVLGMASFFTAAANTPVSSLIMVSELTGSYTLLLPSMWTCAIAYLLGRGFSLYREQLPSRLDSPAHRGDFFVDVLKSLTVGEVVRKARVPFQVVPMEMPLGELNRIIEMTSQQCFPVVDAAGRYRGMFTLSRVRAYLFDPQMGRLAIAVDLADCDTPPLTDRTRLSSAMNEFVRDESEELPVVDADHPETLLGLLRRQDVLTAYAAEVRAISEGTTSGS